jgi:hypothetical protein
VSAVHVKTTSCVSGLWYNYLLSRYAILLYLLLLTLAAGLLHSALGFRVNLLELFLAINLLATVVPVGAGGHGGS